MAGLADLGEVGAGLRVEVDAELVGVGLVLDGERPRVEAEAAEVDGPTTWARSATTRASLVVPLGVATIVVCSQSGALFGTRFW